jgi:hypothetical protein
LDRQISFPLFPFDWSLMQSFSPHQCLYSIAYMTFFAYFGINITLTFVCDAVDLSDAPKELGVPRLAYFWNRFCLTEGEEPIALKWDWKEGEEPMWVNQLAAPPETIVDPQKQLDIQELGIRKYKKAIRRIKIKQFNQALVAKDFTMLKKNQKQLPP